ncbi:MAG: polysaccharide deacetylase family protein [Candidatus Zixiibacteriota bacterium]|nr:MAG: polysaccharide deacetylase family protein [candidate division Zixibacteria bacterium]
MCSENGREAQSTADSIPARILTFHKLQPQFSFGSTNFSPRRFSRLLADLEQRGFGFHSVDSLIYGGQGDSVAITFDDGYQHLAEHLPGLLEKYHLRPTIFVPTAFIGKPNRWDYSHLFQSTRHLDRSSIQTMAAMGVEFGSHGHSHLALTGLSDAALESELDTSRKILEDICGREVTRISYPYGRTNRRVLDLAAKSGYRHGFTMNFPTPDDPPLALGRLAIYGYDTLFTIHQKIAGGRLYWLEKIKARVTNRLSYGTTLYNRVIKKR